MSWDINQAIHVTMAPGGKSKLSCSPPKSFRPSTFTPRRDTTRRLNRRSAFTLVAAVILALSAPALRAQRPSQPSAPQAPSESPDYSIKKDVNLVVLHVSVVNDRGQFVPGLKVSDFHVVEDKADQKISVFSQEDVPVSMGLVIDNSGSMRDKRPQVNAAALTLVKTSNPQDEAFVVNFNDDFYLDTVHDFTNNVTEMTTSTGGLAFFPENVADTQAICAQIARDIRNQYTVAYYPTNSARDGSYRTVQISVAPQRGYGKLQVRTRTGYYARGPALAAGAGN